ncbi:MAG: hypothetical protein ACP5PB_10770 [Acidimicrobiales bacterium]
MSRNDRLDVPHGGAISARGPASVDYVPATDVGFETVPSVVRAQLFATRVIGSKALSASCTGMYLRRRANGTHYQSAKAWWADETRAVLITLQREMAHRGGRQYAPSGPWSVTGTLYHLGPADRPLTTTWRFDAPAATGTAKAPPTVSDDPLDVLPAEVVAPIRGGLSDAWREHSRDSATEYLTAIRVVNDDRVLLLEANRTAATVRQLADAAWVLTTLDAPITRHDPIRLTCAVSEREPSVRPPVSKS